VKQIKEKEYEEKRREKKNKKSSYKFQCHETCELIP